MLEALLYGFYIFYKLINPMPAEQAFTEFPQYIEQQIQTSSESHIIGAKFTLLQAKQPSGTNWFPMQLNKTFETTSDSNGIVRIPLDKLYSSYSDSNMVCLIESPGFGSIAYPAYNLVDSNYPIVLYPAGSIGGQVVDQDGRPMPGVTIHYIPKNVKMRYLEEAVIASIAAFSTTSDTCGRFEFHNASTNSEFYVFAAKPNMLQLYPWNITNLGDRSAYYAGQEDIKVTMYSIYAKIRGKAFNTDTGKSIPGIGFILKRRGLVLRTYSDDLGNYEFACDPCTYTIDSMDDQSNLFCIDKRNVHVSKNQDITEDMHFVYSGELSFYGREADNNDANEFDVSFQYLDTGKEFKLKKRKDDWYPVKQVPRGKYRVLEVVRPGYKWLGDSNNFEVKQGKLTEITFTFEKSVLIGHVYDKTGNAVPNVEIYVVPGSFPIIVTKSDGSFEVPADYLGKGSENKTAHARPTRLLVASDIKHNSGAIVPIEPQETALKVILENGATITGRIVDESGAGVPQADIWLTYYLWNMLKFDVVPRGDFVTDSKGNYAIANLPNGCYFLKASKNGFAQEEVEMLIRDEPNGTKCVDDHVDEHNFVKTRGHLHDIVIGPADKTLDGQITTTDGEIIPELLIKRDGQVLAKTDDQGRFQISNAGSNTIQVSLEYGYPGNMDILPFMQLDGTKLRNNIVIPSSYLIAGRELRKPAAYGGTLHIYIRDKYTKAPVREAQVWIEGQNFVNTVQMPCGVNGELKVVLPEGKCTIIADADGYFNSGSKNLSTEVFHSQVQTIEIALERKLKLRGIVHDINDNPASGLKIIIRCEHRINQISSDENGSFTMEFNESDVAPDKPVWICIFSDKGGLITSYTSIPNEPIIFKCKPCITVWGNVTDTNNIPVTNSKFNLLLQFGDKPTSISILQVPIDQAGVYRVNLPMLFEGTKYEFPNLPVKTFLEPENLHQKTDLHLDLHIRKHVPMTPEQRAQIMQMMKSRHNAE